MCNWVFVWGGGDVVGDVTEDSGVEVSEKIVHLAESHGAYDDPDMWCGETSFDYTEDLDIVTCVECLNTVIGFGEQAERRKYETAAAIFKADQA